MTMIAGMPNAHKDCRVCALIAASQDFSRLLKVYRFDKKLRLRDIVTEMKPHIDHWNSTHSSQKLEYFGLRGLSNHFSKHEPADVQMKYSMDNKSGVPRKLDPDKTPILPGTPTTAAQAQIQIHQKSVAVFEELTSLFERLKSLFDDYMAKHPNINALTIHLEIIRELRKTLAEIAKLKQSKELVKIAVRSVIDTFLTKLVEDSGRSIETMKAKLLAKYPQDRLEIEAIMADHQKAAVDTIMESARTAIERIKTEFALGDSKED